MSTSQPTPDDVALFDELNGESDRACAVLVGAYLDDLMRQVLEASFVGKGQRPKGRPLPKGALFTFSSRVDMLHALGLISEPEARDLSVLNDIRNEFAHRVHGLSFKSPRVRMLVNRLGCVDGVDAIIKAQGERRVFAVAFLTLWVRLEQVLAAAKAPTVKPPKRWPAVKVVRE